MNLLEIKIILLYTMFLISTKSQKLKLNTKSFRPLPTNRLTLVDSPSYYVLQPNGPGTYAFGYEINDPSSGNVQFRDEEKLSNGTVKGSFGYMRADGYVSITKYIADQNGYRSETQTFKSNEKPLNNDNPIPLHPLDHSFVEQQQMLENMNLKVKKENRVKPFSEMDSDRNKVELFTVDSMDNNKYAVKLINNFISTNLPFVALNQSIQKLEKPIAEDNEIGHDFVDFTNDKFHNPLLDEGVFRNLNKNSHKITQRMHLMKSKNYRNTARHRQLGFSKRYGMRRPIL